MFSTNLSATRNYASVGITTGVMAANAHGLVLMLFEGAMLSVAAARMHLQDGHAALKAQAISKSVAIIQDGLMASLDRESGGELAGRLFSLYEYMVLRLIDANISNRTEPLEEVGRLLAELSGAWQAIGQSIPAQSAPGAGKDAA